MKCKNANANYVNINEIQSEKWINAQGKWIHICKCPVFIVH